MTIFELTRCPSDEKMKMFNLDKSKGAIRNVDLIPPPSFSHGDVPFHYVYVTVSGRFD